MISFWENLGCTMNPTIDWRTNTLTFNYGTKKIVVEATKTSNETSCSSIYIKDGSATKELQPVAEPRT